ncbi:unnamed protein product [Amoebophrya sp. A25]|nr:unnamed protein product [Amoebophrya sp. A25]|eukprot:GSA25T00024541001.1
MIALSPNTRGGIHRDATRVHASAVGHADEIEKLLTQIVREFPKIGYTQGMNDVAGSLILNSARTGLGLAETTPLEDFRSLLRTCGGFWSEGMPLMHEGVMHLSTMIEAHLPDLAQHWKRHEVQLMTIVPSGLLTLFSQWFGPDHTVRSGLVNFVLRQKYAGALALVLATFEGLRKNGILERDFEDTCVWFHRDMASRLVYSPEHHNFVDAVVRDAESKWLQIVHRELSLGQPEPNREPNTSTSPKSLGVERSFAGVGLNKGDHAANPSEFAVTTSGPSGLTSSGGTRGYSDHIFGTSSSSTSRVVPLTERNLSTYIENNNHTTSTPAATITQPEPPPSLRDHVPRDAGAPAFSYDGGQGFLPPGRGGSDSYHAGMQQGGASNSVSVSKIQGNQAAPSEQSESVKHYLIRPGAKRDERDSRFLERLYSDNGAGSPSIGDRASSMGGSNLVAQQTTPGFAQQTTPGGSSSINNILANGGRDGGVPLTTTMGMRRAPGNGNASPLSVPPVVEPPVGGPPVPVGAASSGTQHQPAIAPPSGGERNRVEQLEQQLRNVTATNDHTVAELASTKTERNKFRDERDKSDARVKELESKIASQEKEIKEYAQMVQNSYNEICKKNDDEVMFKNRIQSLEKDCDFAAEEEVVKEVNKFLDEYHEIFETLGGSGAEDNIGFEDSVRGWLKDGRQTQFGRFVRHLIVLNQRRILQLCGLCLSFKAEKEHYEKSLQTQFQRVKDMEGALRQSRGADYLDSSGTSVQQGQAQQHQAAAQQHQAQAELVNQIEVLKARIQELEATNGELGRNQSSQETANAQLAEELARMKSYTFSPTAAASERSPAGGPVVSSFGGGRISLFAGVAGTSGGGPIQLGTNQPLAQYRRPMPGGSFAGTNSFGPPQA